MPVEFENTTIPGYFGFVFEKTRPEKSYDYRDVIVFEKLCFQNVFRPHEKGKRLSFKIPPV